MKKLTCAQAKKIDLIEYLASLGYLPQKVRNQDYWFCSPLREEKIPSFKVNRQRNIWFDHGNGKGGDMIDLGKLYFRCNTADFLDRLSHYRSQTISHFHPPLMTSASAGEKKEQRHEQNNKIRILNIRPLADNKLLDYLSKRNIPAHIAGMFCKEVDFLLYDNKHTAIGFQNNDGGYELRSPNFKGTSAPKAVTFIDHQCGELSVFEGFFDYLSYLSILNKRSRPLLSNFLILNSTAFFEKYRELMEQHKEVNLYLDRDAIGKECTAIAVAWNKEKYKDQSWFYKGHKDLNEWLITTKREKRQTQSRKQGI